MVNSMRKASQAYSKSVELPLKQESIQVTCRKSNLCPTSAKKEERDEMEKV